MAKPTKAILTAALLALVASTINNSFGYTTREIGDELVKSGDAEYNPNNVANPENENEFQYRATEQAIEAYRASEAAGKDGSAGGDGSSAEAPKDAVTDAGFTIDKGVAMPTVRASGASNTKYPFDKLEVGDSIHIAATAEVPKPHTKFGSTVSSANARFAKRDAEGKVIVPKTYERKFTIRQVGATDPKGAGARIWRTL